MKLLTVKEAADSLRFSTSTIYRYVRKGIIPYTRKGRRILFEHKELEQWIEKDRHVPNIDLTNLVPVVIDKLEKGVESMPHGKSRTRNYGIGSVFLRTYKSGNTCWAISYINSKGERKQKAIKDAQNHQEALLALLKEKLHTQKDDKKPLRFDELADMYIRDYARVNKKSWRTDESYIKGMREFFRNKLIDSITSQDIEQYKAKRIKDEVQPTTVNKCLQILSKMFNVAISWGRLKHNPCKGVKKYREEPFRRKRVLSEEEEKSLFAAIIPRYLSSMVRIFLNTGLRRKELFQLTWENVDFRNRQIFIRETKTSRSRYVPMNETVYNELKALQQDGKREGLVFVNPKTGKAFVDIRKALYGACRRAKIKNLLLLDLRRTFATRIIEAGADIVTVGHLLGHTSVTTTQIYTMSNQDEKRRAVSLLETKKGERLLRTLLREEKDRFPTYSLSMN